MVLYENLVLVFFFHIISAQHLTVSKHKLYTELDQAKLEITSIISCGSNENYQQPKNEMNVPSIENKNLAYPIEPNEWIMFLKIQCHSTLLSI